jgi:3-isopropylmalate dehydrogenase
LFREEHSPLKGYKKGEIDFVILRESTEGLFASRDGGARVGDEVAVDNLVVTRRSVTRAVRYGCELAMARHRQCRITCVDKSNVFQTYALFRQVFDEVAAEYPTVETSHAYIDAQALYLVRRPHTFDVIVTENMFGDILSDLAAALVGGMGMAPSADIGDHHAVFQPAHGSAPDIAGRGMANPIAAILSVKMMLEHLAARHQEPRLDRAAAAVYRAVEALFAETPCTTPDLGGTMTCAEVGTALCERIVSGG